MIARAFAFLFFLVTAAALAAPVERDLGMRLSYVRVKELPADLPTVPAGRAPTLIVDLRYVKGGDEAVAALTNWIRSRASARTPVLVVANEATSREILRALAARAKDPGVAVVGIEAGHFKPDVPVRSTADEEQRAYDAVEKGAEIATVIADLPNKVRHDEASLAKERPAEPLPEPAPDKSGSKVPGPPMDAALQRAVHLHRALVALKRI